MRNFLAIDIGASSGRHILGRIEGGRLHLDEIYRFPNSPHRANDRLTWDVGRLFAEILEGMKRAGQVSRAPFSVGIDTWAVDYVLLDRDGGRIGDAYSYRSDRTQSVIPSVHERVPFETLYERTGIQFQPFNTVYQLCADAASGKLAGAERLFMLPDYFHYLLTGRGSREYTNATSTGLINTHTRAWDLDVIRALGLPEKLFPETVEAGTELGRLRKEIRDRVGYDTAVILPATHDTASAVVAAGEEGTPYLSSGTWSLLGAVQPQAHTDAYSRACNFSNEGHPGGKVRLQKNIMGLWMIQRLRSEAGDPVSFEELADRAREHPVSCRVDVNDSRFLAPQNMRRAIEEAAGRSLTTEEAAACVYESLADRYAADLGELERVTGRHYDSLTVIGGGSRNRYLNELTGAATGKTIVTGVAEATAVGNLLVQMEAAGEIDPAQAAELVASL